MPQCVRGLVGDLIILLFISFGYSELKVGREYMVDVFNGFSYDYEDIWEWLKKNFFSFFVLPFFQKKHKIKK